MSSTRHAKDGSFHQSRFASSPEFHRGLAANLVAARTAKIENAADVELVWFIQFLSHPHLSGISDGLAGVAADLLSKYGERLGTRQMVKIGKKPGEYYTADEAKMVRRSLIYEFTGQHECFLVMGESSELTSSRVMAARENLSSMYNDSGNKTYGYEEAASKLAVLEEMESREKQSRPDRLPVSKFFEFCRNSAVANLENDLRRFCLDPAIDTSEYAHWYFADLIPAIRDFQKHWIQGRTRRVETSVVMAVAEMLDYTMHAKGLTLLTGPSTVGARFAGRELALQNPGRLRFCEVPSTNDEAGFLKAVARCLGGNWTNYKNSQIRERIESVLQSGELTLVLCGAQNLWPVLNLRESFPRRLAWLIDQTERGAGISMISSPQFFMQKRACEKTGWDSPEFLSKISDAAALPESLTVEELTEIAGVALPAASAEDCEAMALSAVASKKYLANIQQVSDKAKYFAEKAGRIDLEASDINQAIAVVNRSDTLLRTATADGDGGGRIKQSGKAGHPRQPLSASSPLSTGMFRHTSPVTSQPGDSVAAQRGIAPADATGATKG